MSVLSPRQMQVLRLVATGHRTKAIAHRLGLPIRTVEDCRRRTMQWLGAKTSAHAVYLATQRGLLDAPSDLAVLQ